jgi:predicted TIM-barrel fold metal-dependent hydrolase
MIHSGGRGQIPDRVSRFQVIIDIHSHVWQGQRDAIPGYLSALKAGGIDRSAALVLESWRRQVTETELWKGAGNDEVHAAIADHPDRFVLFATVPPQLDDSPDVLQDLVGRLPVKGLKLHPAIQGFDPTNPQVIRFVKKAASLGLPIVIHAGDVGWVGRLAYNSPYYLDDLATNVPDAVLIVAHGGATPLVPWIVKRHPNVYMDTAYAPNWPTLPPFRWKFQCVDEDIVDFVGPEKVLFGTDINPAIMVHPTQVRGRDFPNKTDVAAIVEAGIAEITKLAISDRAKELILGENAKRLLGE